MEKLVPRVSHWNPVVSFRSKCLISVGCCGRRERAQLMSRPEGRRTRSCSTEEETGNDFKIQMVSDSVRCVTGCSWTEGVGGEKANIWQLLRNNRPSSAGEQSPSMHCKSEAIYVFFPVSRQDSWLSALYWVVLVHPHKTAGVSSVRRNNS